MIYLPLGTYGYIYMSINNVTGRKYIGQKKSRRIVEDYFGSGKILRQALTKYGSENFDVTILDIATSKEDLDEKEKKWIAKYDAVNSGEFYNISFGGRQGLTWKQAMERWTDEQWAKWKKSIHDANSHPKSDQTKEKLSKYVNDNMETFKESHKEHSIQMKEKWKNEEYRNNLLNNPNRVHVGAANGYSRPVVCAGIKYDTMKAACAVWKDPRIIRSRLKDPAYPDWYDVNKNIDYSKPCGRRAYDRIPVKIDGVVYKNIKIAAEQFGVRPILVYRRVHSSKYPNYLYEK